MYPVLKKSRNIEELKNRKAKYTALQQQMEETGTTEISTTDPDAQLMAVNNNGVEVSYNVQIAVDQKHKLVVDSEVKNNPADQGQLSSMAKQTKEVLGVEEIKVLDDKGYYPAKELIECERNHIETYVRRQKFTVIVPILIFTLNFIPRAKYLPMPAGHSLSYQIREVKGVKYQTYKISEPVRTAP